MVAADALADDARVCAARGVASWPDLALDDAVLAALADHLSALARAEPDPRAALARIHAADVCLAFACARGEPAALAALEAGCLRDLVAPLRRMHLDEPAIAETIQALRDQQLVGGAPGILGYSGRGPLRAWLRSVAIRIALRDREQQGRWAALDADASPPAGDDLELAYMKKQYGAAFERAFAAAFADLEVEARLLLKQRFGHRVGVVELGKLYGVNPGTISRRVAAARERLVGATRGRMVADLGVASGELSSILRLIESQIDLSLSTAA